MFHGIDRSVIEHESFKEDSVRELIIAPMIAKLGYGAVGSNRAARSAALKNPFIRVGTREHPVTIIPDYMLYADNRPVFVLDAKAPNQSTIDPKHVQQTYSYAFHPEVKVAEFGLCNGLELTIFDMDSFEPVFSLPFEEFESRWGDIEKYLTPRYLLEPALRRFAPDFGTALVRMGLPENGVRRTGSGLALPHLANINFEVINLAKASEYGLLTKPGVVEIVTMQDVTPHAAFISAAAQIQLSLGVRQQWKRKPA